MAGEPTVDPNAMAAPAQGFGQTVSFAFDPNAPPPQKQVIASEGPRVSIQGAGRKQGGVDPNSAFVKPQPDPTMALLQKVGGEMLAKHVDDARTAAYVDGMQRAMGGEALKEIKESEPWYAQAFGDTPVILGARAYTAEAAVTKTVSDQMANLKGIAQLGPQEASAHFARMMKASTIGDPQADAMIIKGLSDQLPTLMKAQAKEHYAYNQNQMTKAQDAAMRSAGAALQAMGPALAEEKITYADMEVASKKLLASVLPVAGQDEASYTKNMAANIRLWANQGNLHAINVLQKSGFMEQAGLSEDQIVGINRSIAAAEVKASTQFQAKNAVTLAKLNADLDRPDLAGRSVEDIYKEMLRVDASFQNATGAQGAIYGANRIVGDLAKGINTIRAARERAMASGAVSADKEAAEAVQGHTIQVKALSGDIAQLKTQPGFTEDKLHTGFEAVVTSNPDKALGIITQNFVNGKYVNPNLSARATAPFRAFNIDSKEGPSNSVLESIDTYNKIKALPGGEATADAYYGEFAPKIELFTRMTAGGDKTQVGLAYKAAFGDEKMFPHARLDDKGREAILKKITSDNSYWRPESVGGDPDIRPEAAQALMAKAEEVAKGWMRVPGMTWEAAYGKSMKSMRDADNFEVLGGFAFENGGTPLKTLMNPLGGYKGEGGGFVMPKDVQDKIFKGFIHNFVKVPTDGNITIQKQGDVGGKPQFSVWSTQADGTSTMFTFDSDMLQHYTAVEGAKMRDSQTAATMAKKFGGSDTDAQGRPIVAYDPVKMWREGTPVSATPPKKERSWLSFGPEITNTPESVARSLGRTTVRNPYDPRNQPD